MTRKQKRLAVIAGGMGFILTAVLLVMFAFGQSIAYFYVPGDLAKADLQPGTRIRLGGLVETGSVVRGEDSESSEIDLLVSMDKNSSLYDLIGFQQSIEKALLAGVGWTHFDALRDLQTRWNLKAREEPLAVVPGWKMLRIRDLQEHIFIQVESTGAGADTVRASIDFFLGANFDNISDASSVGVQGGQQMAMSVGTMNEPRGPPTPSTTDSNTVKSCQFWPPWASATLPDFLILSAATKNSSQVLGMPSTPAFFSTSGLAHIQLTRCTLTGAAT